jgi:hypothetical protein
MVRALAEALPSVKFEHNTSLALVTILSLIDLDDILPKTHAKLGLVGEFSDQPFLHFTVEEISRNLGTRDWESEPNPKPLTTLPDYSDPAASADRIVAQFETLPWTYELFIETPISRDFYSLLGDLTNLGRGLTLLLPSSSHISEHRLPEGFFLRSLSRRDLPTTWNSERYYLRSEVQGFIGQMSSRSAILNFISRAKSLAGFLLALEIYETERPALPQLNRCPILSYRLGTSPATEQPAWLADEDAYVFQNLRSFDADQMTEDKVRARQSGVSLLSAAFASRDQRLVNAARWFFDSFCGTNELLSFVQAMIVLEILFGDKAASDVIGIGQLIANRCAYLIGNTVEQRERIMRDISRIYATRSAIVHRGKDNLTSSERSDFSTLRRLCRRALRQELSIANRGAVLPGAV